MSINMNTSISFPVCHDKDDSTGSTKDLHTANSNFPPNSIRHSSRLSVNDETIDVYDLTYFLIDHSQHNEAACPGSDGHFAVDDSKEESNVSLSKHKETNCNMRKRGSKFMGECIEIDDTNRPGIPVYYIVNPGGNNDDVEIVLDAFLASLSIGDAENNKSEDQDFWDFECDDEDDDDDLLLHDSITVTMKRMAAR